jgi:hypothetical protein
MNEARTFFPPRVFAHRAEQHDFLADWYSRHLAALQEPSLWRAREETSRHCYRFLWLRAFHAPIAVRLEIDPSETGLLVVKMTNGQGGYEPGDLVLDRTVPLAREQATDFLVYLAKASFWEMPVRDPTRLGLDGAEWVIEGIRDRRYHVVSRWCPDEGPYRDAALTLVQWADLEVSEIY